MISAAFKLGSAQSVAPVKTSRFIENRLNFLPKFPILSELSFHRPVNSSGNSQSFF